MECSRIDESDCTGSDLLNPEQRFQGPTAAAISDADAAQTSIASTRSMGWISSSTFIAPQAEILRDAVVRDPAIKQD